MVQDARGPMVFAVCAMVMLFNVLLWFPHWNWRAIAEFERCAKEKTNTLPSVVLDLHNNCAHDHAHTRGSELGMAEKQPTVSATLNPSSTVKACTAHPLAKGEHVRTHAATGYACPAATRLGVPMPRGASRAAKRASC